jgi:hypothetical protein
MPPTVVVVPAVPVEALASRHPVAVVVIVSCLELNDLNADRIDQIASVCCVNFRHASRERLANAPQMFNLEYFVLDPN